MFVDRGLVLNVYYFNDSVDLIGLHDGLAFSRTAFEKTVLEKA